MHNLPITFILSGALISMSKQDRKTKTDRSRRCISLPPSANRLLIDVKLKQRETRQAAEVDWDEGAIDMPPNILPLFMLEFRAREVAGLPQELEAGSPRNCEAVSDCIPSSSPR